MGIWCQEESIWFQVSYIGSRVSPDAAGWCVGCAAHRHRARTCGPHRGLRRRSERIAAAACTFDPAQVRAYLELHIEQALQPGRGWASSLLALASPAILAIRMHASKAITTMSACRAAFVTTRRWQVRSSPWHWIIYGRRMRREMCRWPARSGDSIGKARIALSTVRPEPGLPHVLADRWALHRIIDNLVANGIKFTASGGSVEISAYRSPEGIVVSIKDTGTGMPPHVLEQLGAPFFQADTGAARRFEGMGAGLALSVRLADAMGAALHFDSAPGRGTTVSLVLPESVSDEIRPRGSLAT